MSDNVTANSGTGGAVFATDDIGSVHYPRSKVVWGPDGTANDADVATGKPLPVQLRSDTGVVVAKAEDAAHASGDFGVMALTVRSNTAASTSGTEGDYQPLITDTNGRLHVNDPSAVTIASAVFAEDVAATAADKGIAVLAVRRDANTSLVGTDNDYVNLQVSALGALKVAITEDSVGSAVDTDDGTVAGSQTSVALTIGLTQVWDGSNWKRVSTATPMPAAASPETSTVFNGLTALTPKYAVIAASSSGDNTLVAAVTSKKIRVLAYNMMANGTVNAKFQSGASGTDKTGPKYLVVNAGIVAPFNPVGWFETGSNTLLNLNLSAGIAVGGELVYVEV